MAIRWDEFPHNEIRLRIYSRLAHNAAERSAYDSLRHILQRGLPSLKPEDHGRFIELEASSLVKHLRCTRDIYQEFVDKHNCRPTLEAHWVVLRCAVFPTAVALLQERAIGYAKLTRIPGRDLSLLFGIPTLTCYKDVSDGVGLLCPPDLDDKTVATDKELQSLGGLVHEDSLLWFRDIRDGAAVGCPLGGGPFAIDDASAIRNSFALCGLSRRMMLPTWLGLRDKWWHQCTPWTDGLCNLFGSVQEELLSQWRALPPDSLAHELALRERTSRFGKIVVPADTEHSSPPEQRPALTPKSYSDRERLGERMGEWDRELRRIAKAARAKRQYHEANARVAFPDFTLWKAIDDSNLTPIRRCELFGQACQNVGRQDGRFELIGELTGMSPFTAYDIYKQRPSRKKRSQEK
jgi:hypothetical protein